MISLPLKPKEECIKAAAGTADDSFASDKAAELIQEIPEPCP